MKKYLLLFLFAILGAQLFSQTAKDFNCSDCASVTHELFSVLDSGKIVVICWVMPCGSCVLPAKTTYNVVQSYATSNPGKVIMYLCDDYADTPCSSISKWAKSNAITKATMFSNVSVKFSDYGAYAMPKIAVLGGSSHKVYNIQNYSVNYNLLLDAINLAISESSASVKDIKTNINSAGIFPNPAYGFSKLKINLLQNTKIQVSVYNNFGQKVLDVFNGNIGIGENQLDIKSSVLDKGTYFIRIKEEKAERELKFIVL